LICFGGADPLNLTQVVLTQVQKNNQFNSIIVVTGPGYAYSDSLIKTIERDHRVIYHHAIDENEIIIVMQMADVAIVPASGILYEALAFKIPVITGTYIANQALFLKAFQSFKQVYTINSFEPELVQRAIDKVLADDVCFDDVIDGESGSRILDLFRGLLPKTYIITGANRGLGEALTDILVMQKDTKVISISRKLSAEQIRMLDTGFFFFIEQDMTQALNEGLLDQLAKIIGTKDRIVFINNAASIEPIKPVQRINKEELLQSLLINIYTPIILFNNIQSRFSTNLIDYVNITSGAANKSIANWALYSSSKAYMDRFVEIMRVENSERRRFYSIDPGMVDTGMQQQIRQSDFPKVKYFCEAKENNSLRTPKEAAYNILKQI
jgi:benzil reductase ((S)-benzoin forming)